MRPNLRLASHAAAQASPAQVLPDTGLSSMRAELAAGSEVEDELVYAYYRAIKLFLGIVWREHENGWRVDIRTAWQVARIMWLED
jgi:hypothetical protein